jgi:hypothetical protein
LEGNFASSNFSLSLPLPGRCFLDGFDESSFGFGFEAEVEVEVSDTESGARDFARLLD